MSCLVSICYLFLFSRIFLRRLFGFLPGFLKDGECAGQGCRQVVRAMASRGFWTRYRRSWEWYGTILGMVRNDSRNGTEPFLSFYCTVWKWHGWGARIKKKARVRLHSPPAPDFMQLKSTRCTLYTHSHKNTY